MDKFALTVHAWATGRTIQFDEIEILFKSENWGPCTMKESLENLRENLMMAEKAVNREEGIVLSKSSLSLQVN